MLSEVNDDPPRPALGPYRRPGDLPDAPPPDPPPRSEHAPGCFLVLLALLPFVCLAATGNWSEREGMIATLALVLAASTLVRGIRRKP